MIRVMTAFVAGAAALGAAGCSTAPLLPDIERFAGAVGRATTAVDERHARENVAALYVADRDRALLDAGGLIVAQDCDSIGRPVDTSRPDADAPPPCALTTERVIDPATGETAPFPPPALGPDLPSLRGHNARRLAVALSGYAASLSALAASDTPQKLAVSFGAAGRSVQGLVETAAEAGGGGISAEEAEAISTGIDLAGALLAEAFEARRHRAVTRIVREADDAVRDAAFSVANWYWIDESVPLEARRAAVEEAQAAHLRNRTPETAAALRAAHAAFASAESEAGWRSFQEIADTHGAILATLDAPPDLATLAAANARIADLAAKIDAFVKAAEKLND